MPPRVGPVFPEAFQSDLDTVQSVDTLRIP